jgi:parvulin-like peptidyl-prolyl isomerase
MTGQSDSLHTSSVLYSEADPALIELPSGRPLLSIRQLHRMMRRHGLDHAIAQAYVLEELGDGVDLDPELEDELVSSYLESGFGEPSLDPQDARAVATRSERLKRFREACFSDEVEIRFLERKPDLDQVMYSLIRVNDQELAEELYQRIREGEADISDLAPRFSLGSERETGGLQGPLPLSVAHPELESRLRVGRPGQLWPPFFVVDIWVVLRFERLIPAQLDAACRETMLDELFDAWLEERIRQLLAGEVLPPLPFRRLAR